MKPVPVLTFPSFPLPASDSSSSAVGGISRIFVAPILNFFGGNRWNSSGIMKNIFLVRELRDVFFYLQPKLAVLEQRLYCLLDFFGSIGIP